MASGAKFKKGQTVTLKAYGTTAKIKKVELHGSGWLYWLNVSLNPWSEYELLKAVRRG